MNKNRTIKAVIAILVVIIVLTISVNVALTELPMIIDDTTLVNVAPANVNWVKTYGGNQDDRAFNILQTSGGYLVVGSSKSIIPNTIVGWAIMLDDEGNMVWNKTYLDGFGTELRCALNTTDGYLLVGNQFYASGNISGYVAKTDSQGNLQWNTTLAMGQMSKLFSAIAAPDGYIVLGLATPTLNGTASAWATKLDLDGNVVWSKTYLTTAESAARAGVLTDSGNYLLAGYSAKADGDYNFQLLELNPNGDVVWNQTYGGTGSQKAYSIAKAQDGYVVTGDIQNPDSAIDAWVIKVDLTGNLVWSKTVGGKDADSPAYITQSQDGNFLVAGFTFSYGAGNRDFWLFKISADGQVLWSCTWGNQGFQEAYGVVDVGNNKYVMVGWTDPFGRPDLIGKATYDYAVVNLNAPQISKVPSDFQLASYILTLVAVVLLSIVLATKWKTTKKKKTKKAVP